MKPTINGTALIDPATELEVIGAAIHSPEWLAQLDAVGLFACDETRTILQALLDMEQSGVPLSVSALTGFLNDHGRLDGLVPFITDLGLESSRETFDFHLDRLRGMGVRRSLCTFATKDAPLALESDPEAALRHLRQRLEEIEALNNGTSGRKLPPLVDAAAVLAAPPALPAELIEGILHQSSKAVIGGPSKGNKTWCLTDMAAAVATGSPWWGFETRKARVLYLNMEVQHAFFVKRLAAICEAKRITVSPSQLTIWPLRGYCADLSHLADEIIRQVRGKAFGLIIIDPIYKVTGGRDENSAGDIAALLNEIERLAVQSGAAVAFGAHFSKGNQAAKESIDRIGGSGVFARDPDTILTLTRHEEENAFTVEPILRNHAPVEPFVIRWDFPLMQRAGELDPTKLQQAKAGREADYTEDDVLAVLAKAKEALTSTAWQKLAEAELGISRRCFFKVRRALETRKRIRESVADKGWMPS